MGRRPVLGAGSTVHYEDPSRKFQNSSPELPQADFMSARLWPCSGHKTGPYCGPYVGILLQLQSECSGDKEKADSIRAHCWTLFSDSGISLLSF